MGFLISSNEIQYRIDSDNIGYVISETEDTPLEEMEFKSIQGVAIEQVTIILKLDPPGRAYMDWGDGNIITVNNTGHDHAITSAYITAETEYDIKISGDFSYITKIEIVDSGTVAEFNIGDLNTMALSHFALDNVSGISGSLMDLPSSIRALTLWDIGSLVTGNINQITGLVYLWIKGLTGSTIDLDYLGSDIAYIQIDGDNHTMLLTGSINNFGDLVRSLHIEYVGTEITGSINNLSGCDNLGYVYLYRMLNLTGSIDNLVHTNLRTIQLYDAGAFTGNVSNLSDRLQRGVFRGCGELTGNVEDIANNALTIYLVNSGSSVIWGGGVIPGWASADLYFQLGWTTSELDNFLISWALTAESAGSAIVNLKGTNEPRSALSDAAVITLTALGKDIQTN